jgi:hypothetical protein
LSGSDAVARELQPLATATNPNAPTKPCKNIDDVEVVVRMGAPGPYRVGGTFAAVLNFYA